MNIGQFALIKKDIRGITSNKQIFAVLLIVPLVLTIVLPSIFVLVISFAPDAAADFQKLLDMLPVPNGEYSQQQQIFSLILNQIMPPFFLIVPIMQTFPADNRPSEIHFGGFDLQEDFLDFSGTNKILIDKLFS